MFLWIVRFSRLSEVKSVLGVKGVKRVKRDPALPEVLLDIVGFVKPKDVLRRSLFYLYIRLFIGFGYHATLGTLPSLGGARAFLVYATKSHNKSCCLARLYPMTMYQEFFNPVFHQNMRITCEQIPTVG